MSLTLPNSMEISAPIRRIKKWVQFIVDVQSASKSSAELGRKKDSSNIKITQLVLFTEISIEPKRKYSIQQENHAQLSFIIFLLSFSSIPTDCMHTVTILCLSIWVGRKLVWQNRLNKGKSVLNRIYFVAKNHFFLSFVRYRPTVARAITIASPQN